jgi:hypothetical protein
MLSVEPEQVYAAESVLRVESRWKIPGQAVHDWLPDPP